VVTPDIWLSFRFHEHYVLRFTATRPGATLAALRTARRSGMPTSTPLPEQVRFGEFELNLRTRELRKDGRKSDLQEQPFLVLTLLLERPGDLVTREELIQRLWPSGTFVDFEHSLNKAVKRLREALKDSAEQPRFIETLPRRGYRFVGALEQATDQPASAERGTVGDGATAVAADQSLGRLRVWMVRAVVVMVSAIASVAVFGVLHGRRPSSVAGSPASMRSLVVLPFENLSGKGEQDYFTDGMTDELITDLGQIGSIRVISRTSAMQYKAAHKSLPDIAQELKVEMVVEGTVVRSGDRVRITAQLIQARDDRHLWAQSYERDVRDVLAVQGDVARSIASQVQIKLTSRQRQQLSDSPALSPEAQDAYLRGHYFAEKGTIDDLQKSIPYFEEAIRKEPNAAAYAGLASAYVNLGHILYLPPQQAFPPAKAAALKALELDPSIEEAHTALGNVKFLFDWDFPGAEKEFQLALQANPSSSRALNVYAGFLNAMGRPEEADSRALEEREVDPLSLAAITDTAWQLYWSRRYEQAIAEARRVTEMNPNYFPAHVCLGLAYEQTHEFSSAVSELEKAAGFCRDKCYGLIGQVSALSGDKDGAYQALKQLQRRPYVSPWLVAIIYAELGEKEQALSWLEKAYQGREHDLAFARVWPMFDGLRSEPRYQELLRRVGLPQ
jgi:TolB-like protein/DNA-binding winged helix-turn-helix (wHTH) protein/Flp pilus assembly protein TadD